MKIAVAQIAPRLGDTAANLRMHLEGVRRARSAGADLVVFPELSLTGYMLQDLVPEVAEDPRRGTSMKALAAASKRIGIVAGFVERAEGLFLYNAAACFTAGALAHLHRKVYLPTYGMFDEGRYFAAGESFDLFDAPWGRTGVLICEDFWHLSSSYLLSLQGMEVLIVLSVSPAKGLDASRKLRSQAIWSDLGRVIARQLGCWVVYANRSGYEEGWAFQGGSYICSPSGEMAAEARALEEDFIVAAIPPSAIRKARLAAPLMRDEKLDLVRREMERISSGRSAEPFGAKRPSRRDRG